MYDLKITVENPEEAVIIIAILDEIKRAKAKHPVWPTDVVKQAAIVLEEAGEVIREANNIDEGHGNEKDLRKELIQTAGTCIRMLQLMLGYHVTKPAPNIQNAKIKGQGLKACFPDDI